MDWIRWILFFLPYYISFIFLNFRNISHRHVLLGGFIAVFSSLIGLLFQRKDLVLLFNTDLYSLMSPMNLRWFTIDTYSLIGASLFEEVFYRGFAFNIGLGFTETTILSSILFTLAHGIHPSTRSAMNIKRYLILFFLGVGWSWSYQLSGSIAIPIVAHFLYNLPQLLVNYKRLVFTKNSSNSEGGVEIEFIAKQ